MEQTEHPLVPKGWFITFGIFQILLGAALTLMMLFSLAAAFFPQSQTPMKIRVFSTILSTLSYAGLSAIFMSCGIGILKPKRWAHRLMKIISWLWLVFGIFGLVIMLLVVFPMLKSSFSEQGLPGSATSIALVVVSLITAVFYVITPGLFTIFYNLNSVRQTVDEMDPASSWLDACPASVLALSFLYAITSLTMLAVAPLGSFPFFGFIVTGLPATFLFLVSAAVCAWLAYGCYRLEVKAYWVSVISTVFWGISGTLSFVGQGWEEFYRSAGYPAENIELMQRYKMGPETMTLIMAISTLSFLAYLWYVRNRFFLKTNASR